MVNTVDTVVAQLSRFDPSLFHFMRPQILWGLPVLLLVWILLRKVAGSHQWEQYISKQLVAALRTDARQHSSAWRLLILLIWGLIVLAAAGPSWQKQTAPVVENQRAVVLVLDLSPSMLAQDLKPDRLTRAKYKLIDILRQLADGHIALVAYAGDAHTVSPLSDDPKTIEALLPALHPSIMPSSGSNVEAGVELAIKLLKDARAPSGEIILITDGVAEQALDAVRRTVSAGAKRLSVLGVGSGTAAPIPQSGGGFLRDHQGEIVLTAVNSAELDQLASSLNGRYLQVQADNSDVSALVSEDLASLDLMRAGKAKPLDLSALESSISYDSWVDMGHLLAILILPFALLLFRRGLIYILPLAILLPPSAEAAEFGWQDLWKTPDQQAAELYQAENFDAAAKRFERTDWRTAANYRAGNYAQVIAALEGKTDVQSLYNKANALALNGDKDEAIATYQEVLNKQADHAGAAFNKKLLESLPEQEQQSQSDSEQKSDPQQDSEQDQSQPQDSSPQQGQDSGDQPAEQEQNEPQPNGAQADEEASDEGQDPTQSKQEPGTEEGSQQDLQQDSQQDSDEQSEDPSQSADGSTDAETAEDNDAQQEAQATQWQDSPEPLDEDSEQWLRAIQDDPGRLLRNKFKYQQQQRKRNPTNSQSTQETRY